MPGKHPGRSPTSLNFTRQEYNTSRQWESRRLSRHVLGCSSVELRHLEFKDVGIILSTKPRHCHSSRRREGGGDLTLVVRIFHARCDVLQSLLFSRFHLFSVDFQERHRQIPDVSRGEQIVCDKRIVGAEELFANKELRDVYFI